MQGGQNSPQIYYISPGRSKHSASDLKITIKTPLPVCCHFFRLYIRKTFINILLNTQFTPYQLNGISKLLSYKQSLTPEKHGHMLSFKAALKLIPGNFLKKQAQAFINIFCEYQLADTDYDVLQKDSPNFTSQEHHIQHMQLEVVLKTLTYIIWTDRIVDGYFFAKIYDNTMYWLLERLEALLSSGHAPAPGH